MILARLKAALAGLALFLLGLGGAWLKGRSAGRSEARAGEDRAYRETRERIDAVEDADALSDADVARRLRQHAGQPDRDL